MFSDQALDNWTARLAEMCLELMLECASITTSGVECVHHVVECSENVLYCHYLLFSGHKQRSV